MSLPRKVSVLGSTGSIGVSTLELFDKSGVPLAAITGPANVLFEFVGGAAMILGLAVRPVGVLMALNMVGAWIFVHTGGIYALDNTGPELVIALAALRAHPQGAGAALVGRVQEDPPGLVLLKTGFGGTRIVDLLVGDPLPRIC